MTFSKITCVHDINFKCGTSHKFHMCSHELAHIMHELAKES